MFIDCAKVINALFFGEFTYAGKCFAKYIYYKSDDVVIFLVCSLWIGKVPVWALQTLKHHF